MKSMGALDEFAVEDLKSVYRVLHAHLMDHTELMDSELFLALQSHLQARARKDGVDPTAHAEWARWLDAR
jgi:hypothetical protein